MRDNYDFSNSIKNPYYDRLKKTSKKQPLTIFLDDEIVSWYQENEPVHQAEIILSKGKNCVNKREK